VVAPGRPRQAPDLWHGWHGDVPVVYAPVYGAARAVEPVHIFGICGTPTAVHIGSCGALQPGVHIGDVVLSEHATIGEGASHYYGGRGTATAHLGRVARAAALLAGTGVHSHRGTTLTTSALLQRPDHLVQEWAAAGHLSVDMEASAVFSAARHFAMRAASLMFVWDEVPFRSWADGFSAEEQAAQDRASDLVFEIALALA
jgi:purine-nucleoside phosphorylase